jgi:hypothetical protein
VNSLPTATLESLRSHPKVWFCVPCLALIGSLLEPDFEALATLVRSCIDADDPKAEEHGTCGRCRAVGLVVSAQDRRHRTHRVRNA